jgi:hypothetical protein
MSSVERRFKPGADIAPLTLDAFDRCHEYLRRRVLLLGPACRRAVTMERGESNPDDDASFSERDRTQVDNMIQELIRIDRNLPNEVRQLIDERPTVFDILSSAFRYDANNIELQRRMLQRVRGGHLELGKAMFEMFKEVVPNSDRIIHDMQEEARRKGHVNAAYAGANADVSNSLNLQ